MVVSGGSATFGGAGVAVLSAGLGCDAGVGCDEVGDAVTGVGLGVVADGSGCIVGAVSRATGAVPRVVRGDVARRDVVGATDAGGAPYDGEIAPAVPGVTAVPPVIGTAPVDGAPGTTPV